MSKSKQVYQFKITLLDTKPPIWRRIQVPENYRFWDLHVAIQDAMGWEDDHLHEFRVHAPLKGITVSIGLPSDNQYLKSTREKIADYFSPAYAVAEYEYDFGDGWLHTVKLEKILPTDPGQNYPVCLAGKMACPPEDCGGVGGFYNMLEALKDPQHPDHMDVLDWIEDFDPEAFDPADVVFDDPIDREYNPFLP